MEKLQKKDMESFNKYCSGYNYIPPILDSVHRIVVLGDIHGDYTLTINLLKLGKLIDDNLNWIGKNTYVVQVGDQIDRCRPLLNEMSCMDDLGTYEDEDSDGKILELFSKLQRQAIENGGMVISLLGNHEIMNLLGDFRYVSKRAQHGGSFSTEINRMFHLTSYEYLKDFIKETQSGGSMIERKRDFGMNGKYAKLMGCTRLPAIIIGSNLFVHAGITTHFVDTYGISKKEDLYDLNKNIREWILGLSKNKTIKKMVKDEESIFWTRIMGKINNECPFGLDEILKLFHVNDIIVGHTPQFISGNAGINSICDGKIWRVDTGSSRAYHYFDSVETKESKETKKMESRYPQILIITDDKKFEIEKLMS
jgi:hypothetical protein